MANSSNSNGNSSIGNSSNGNGKSKGYFDLHTTGLGYLGRVRERPGKRGFLACDISALRGACDDVEYSKFDVIVSGSDAKHLIRKCEKAVNDNRKVLFGFRLGDLRLEQFTYPADYRVAEKAGQPGASLKARLLFIFWIKIDGKLVYKAARQEPEDTPTSDESSDVHTDSVSDIAGEPSGDIGTRLPASEPTASQANAA